MGRVLGDVGRCVLFGVVDVPQTDMFDGFCGRGWGFYFLVCRNEMVGSNGE